MWAVVHALVALALRFDQLGYAAESRVWAVLVGERVPAARFSLVDVESGRVVGGGVAGPALLQARSLGGTSLVGRRIELGTLAPGRYQVVLEDGRRFPPLRVTRAPHAAAVPAVVRFLRAQRCGATRAEISRHGACHLRDGVAVDDGYDGEVTAASGPAVLAAGGWHDAGDYVKFVGTTAFVAAVLAIMLRDHAGGGELRAELRWGLDWLLAMVGGGALHHQVSGARDHDAGFRRPEDDARLPVPGYAQRPVFRFAPGRGANLLGRSAAAFAAAAELFKDDPAYAAQLLAAARRSYAEARRRPAPQEPHPRDFYGERSVADDLALGAAELARTTGEPAYRRDALAWARSLGTQPGTPLSWGSVDALALAETARLFPAGSPERADLGRRLARLAAPIVATDSHARGPAAVFRYALPRLGNGSIAESLGAAATCLASRHPACVEVARSQLHWLYGQNPFGLSFQIGLGESFPQRPHHSLAQTARIQLDGAIVGGPTGISELRRAGPLAHLGTRDLFYEDDPENWIVNEPAIDFVAPLVFVLAELGELE